MKRDVYAEVSERILAELERGALPSIKNVPQNAVTNRPYSGCNVILLWLARNRGAGNAKVPDVQAGHPAAMGARASSAGELVAGLGVPLCGIWLRRRRPKCRLSCDLDRPVEGRQTGILHCVQQGFQSGGPPSRLGPRRARNSRGVRERHMARAIVTARAARRAAYEPLYDIDPHTGASIEVFYADRVLAESFGTRAGWFWWACQHGRLPDDPPIGPFATSYTAYRNALDKR
jgi:hypothetical protein